MNKFFRDDKMINKQLLKRNIQGLFSYFIGADPRAFAKKVFHNVQVPMDGYQWSVQTNVYQREQDIASSLAHDAAKDWEHYKLMVGEIRGLTYAREEIKALLERNADDVEDLISS